MRAINTLQRQIMDLIYAQQNSERTGKISEVQYDQENKRWMAKFKSGEGEEAFETDWRPWKSFSHPSIKMSIPPQVGQAVMMKGQAGSAEMSHIEPYHYDPDNQSPHDKEDEIFIRVEKKRQTSQSGSGSTSGSSGEGSSAASSSESGSSQEDPDQILDMKFTKDGIEFKIGKSKLTMGAKGFELSHDKNKWTLDPEKITTEVDGTKLETKKEGSTFMEGFVKHDDRKIDKSHTHKGVMPGTGNTEDPNP